MFNPRTNPQLTKNTLRMQYAHDLHPKGVSFPERL